MARFAWDCLKKSSIVFNAMAGRLGADTTTLNLRIGIHSGPVTAGVLRGEKGRFQIFGDTGTSGSVMVLSYFVRSILILLFVLHFLAQ